MDLKLGFCVLSLNLLILLAAYGTEARKMAEDHLGKRLNFPVVDDVVQGTNVLRPHSMDLHNYHTWIYDNLGEDAKKQADDFVHSSSNMDLHDKDDNHFWIYNNQQEHAHLQTHKEDSLVSSSSHTDLHNKDDNHFWIYDNQGENGRHNTEKENGLVHSSSHVDLHSESEENAQVQLAAHVDLENKDDTRSWVYNNQGEKAQQERPKENAHVHSTSHTDLHNKEDSQGENDPYQTKEESAHIHSSSHMDHIDPSLMVFFFMHDLKLGETMTVYFPRRDPSSSPQFYPKEKADAIPFSLKALPNLLQRFSFSQSSPQGKAMKDTLRECESQPIKGETKYCATSLEAMLEFVQGIMGDKTQSKVHSTKHFTNSTSLLQKYTILDVPQEVSAPKMVACHTMPYPYAVYYCHYQKSESKVFKVSLGGEDGDRMEAIAVCHLDTSQWSPNHVSFRVLGILPGTSPVCHFFPSDNLVWVPKTIPLELRESS